MTNDNKSNLLKYQLEKEETDLQNFPATTQFEYYKLKNYTEKATPEQLKYIALKFIALYLKQRAITLYGSSKADSD